MAEKLSVKRNAVDLLDRALALRARKKQYGIIVLSSATDPYLQFEQTELLTRQLLEIILHYRFPVHIIAKSDLVSRDFDLLKQIDAEAILPLDLQGKLTHRAFITFSFSTIDMEIASIFEPGAPSPELRLDTLSEARKMGLCSGVSLMPELILIRCLGLFNPLMQIIFFQQPWPCMVLILVTIGRWLCVRLKNTIHNSWKNINDCLVRTANFLAIIDRHLRKRLRDYVCNMDLGTGRRIMIPYKFLGIFGG